MTGDIWVIDKEKIWYSQKFIDQIIDKCLPYIVDIGDDIYTEFWMGKRELAREILNILDYRVSKGE